MGYKHFSVEQMVTHPHKASIPTAPLDEFLEEYEADDNLWWRVECGHHQNLFEAATEERNAERALADELADVLSHMVVGWRDILGADLAEHPSVVEVMAKYRKARGRTDG